MALVIGTTEWTWLARVCSLAKSFKTRELGVMLAVENGSFLSNVNFPSQSGHTALFLAVSNADVATVELLLSVVGINVNARNRYGTVPLHAAAKTGNMEVFTLLMNAGALASINDRDRFGGTPLTIAVKETRYGVFEALLRLPGIDVNLTDERVDATPLHIAVRHGQPEMVRRLLSHTDIDVNFEDEEHCTPLDGDVYKDPEYVSDFVIECQVFLLNDHRVHKARFIKNCLNSTFTTRDQELRARALMRSGHGRLDLRDGILADDDVLALTLHLSRNRDIAGVDLRGNPWLTASVAPALLDVIARNSSLLFVHLAGGNVALSAAQVSLENALILNQDAFVRNAGVTLGLLRKKLSFGAANETLAHIGAMAHPECFVPRGPQLYDRAYEFIMSLLK
jgi:ankyrin repeat protein